MTYDTTHLRRKLIGLIFVCLAVRVVMPAGYMPAPIGEGLPFVLCPGGLSGASLILAAQASSQDHHAGHGGAHDHASDDGSHFWESCPFDPAFGSALVASDANPFPPELAQSRVATVAQLPNRSAGVRAFHARAPPRLESRSA